MVLLVRIVFEIFLCCWGRVACLAGVCFCYIFSSFCVKMCLESNAVAHVGVCGCIGVEDGGGW